MLFHFQQYVSHDGDSNVGTSQMAGTQKLSPEVREELRLLIKETVEETVGATLLRLGLQADNPIEVQKDFQHLREWRTLTNSLKLKAMVTLLGLAVTGSAAALWIGLQSMLGRGPGT